MKPVDCALRRVKSERLRLIVGRAVICSREICVCAPVRSALISTERSAVTSTLPRVWSWSTKSISRSRPSASSMPVTVCDWKPANDAVTV